MKSRLSPTVVGGFVLGAIALAVTSVIYFGGGGIFRKPQRFITYFDESVHGLDLGSNVKLRGVRIGRVASISVRFDPQEKQSFVVVVCEVDRNVATDLEGEVIALTDQEQLRELIDRGLRARLSLVGITGLLYIELDFQDAELPEPPVYTFRAEYPVIPAAPSVISEFTHTFSEMVARLREVDFSGIGADLRELLATVNRQAAALDLPALASAVTEAAQSIGTFFGSPEMQHAVGELALAAGDLRELLAAVGGQVEPLGAELALTLEQARGSLEAFAAAADNVRMLFGPQSGLGQEALTTLHRLSAAAESVRELADFLERNPAALLRGRRAGDVDLFR